MLAYELDPEQIRNLSPEDFHAADNREIFRVIAEAIESGADSIPSLAVVDRLRQAGALQAAGGAENIDRIVEEQMVPKAGIAEAAAVAWRKLPIGGWRGAASPKPLRPTASDSVCLQRCR